MKTSLRLIVDDPSAAVFGDLKRVLQTASVDASVHPGSALDNASDGISVVLLPPTKAPTALRSMEAPGTKLRHLASAATDGPRLTVVWPLGDDITQPIEFAEHSTEASALLRTVHAAGVSIRPDSAIGVRVISESLAKASVAAGFRQAAIMQSREVVLGHKADNLKCSDGLFLEAARAVADGHPKSSLREVLIDTLCCQLAMDLSDFDVIVVPSLYGTLVSELVEGLIGPCAVAEEHWAGGRVVVAPAPTGGSWAANSVLAVAAALDHLRNASAARRLRAALPRLADGCPAGTQTDAIAAVLPALRETRRDRAP